MDTTLKTGLANLLSERTMPAADALIIKTDTDALRCVACGHRCFIREGKAGICRVRFNRGGTLRVPAGYVAGLQIDPIEKKPFFHAYPGRDALSFGMFGCDFHCGYCQNWVTSQALKEDRGVVLPRASSPQELISLALENRARVLVSTYNEPLITSDWAVKIFEPAREQGLACGYVSNGNATPEVLEYIKPFVSLYKIDLKSFDEKKYHKLGGVLRNLLDSIIRVKQMGFWLEIVTLVIPGFNDGDDELKSMARFIASVSKDIPWHVTAFHPDYKMTGTSRTTAQDLDRVYAAGKEAGLHFVYPGNLPGQVGDRENTVCHHCSATLIRRNGFRVLENRMKCGVCSDCGVAIPGVWEAEPPVRSVGTGLPRALRN